VLFLALMSTSGLQGAANSLELLKGLTVREGRAALFFLLSSPRPKPSPRTSKYRVNAPCPTQLPAVTMAANPMDNQDADASIESLKLEIERTKSLNKQLQAQIGELTRLIVRSKAERPAEADVESQALTE
jgi:hypothetical protein